MRYDNPQDDYRAPGAGAARAAESTAAFGKAMYDAYMSAIARALKIPMDEVTPMIRARQQLSGETLEEIL
jgi:hypothetical protein